MEIFDSTYYKINKYLQQSLGCWPYQKPTEKYILRFFIFGLNISLLIPQFIYLIKGRSDLNGLINSLTLLNIQFVHIFKYSTCILNNDEMETLFNTIREDWQVIKTKEEHALLQKYADEGRKISLGYLIGEYGLGAIFILIIFVPRLLDVLLPLNDTRPYRFIYETDYLIDQQEYYTPVIIHQILLCTVIVTSVIANDTTYTIFVHHVCGMFAIVRSQLLNMVFQETSKDNTWLVELKIRKQMTECVEKHRKAIWFCDTLESTNNVLLCIILLTAVIGLSVSGVQAMSKLDDPAQAIRSICVCMAHFIHIYYYSWNSQKIIDHSGEIFHAAYNSEWYKCVGNTSKPLRFMMLRSIKPCVQTAGHMFPMTLMNFTVVVKTSMSYFTMLLAVQ